jgi:hypothetical protein
VSKHVCPKRGCPSLIPAGTRYCPTHEREYDRARGTRQARGYDTAHDQLRASWQRRINDGELVLCADGCGTRITGRAWDLGHTADRSAYIGPMTQAHNRADGGRRAHL